MLISRGIHVCLSFLKNWEKRGREMLMKGAIDKIVEYIETKGDEEMTDKKEDQLRILGERITCDGRSKGYNYLHARASARVIVPIIMKLVKPMSVVDVGCADGTWLSVFEEYRVNEITGIDRDWEETEKLRIPREHFIVHDLSTPFKINRKFDLVVSLEVAEHLPKQCAEVFIDTLTHLGDVILFSAAIPFQGSVVHVNEQWQDYWMKLFSNRGYVPVDAIRRKIWQNPDVGVAYAQNTVVYVKKESLPKYPLLETGYNCTFPTQISIVHPKQYLHQCELMRATVPQMVAKNIPLRMVLKASPYILKNVLTKYITNLRLRSRGGR
jgi:2-polyprenyl-3-methyl-5-hydroxy-6-metoxy-1,4-benzoquinol methylase